MSFEIIPAGDHLHDLMLIGPHGKPEFIDRFDNKVRAWLVAKEIAAQRGISPGDAPWMRLTKTLSANAPNPRSF